MRTAPSPTALIRAAAAVGGVLLAASCSAAGPEPVEASAAVADPCLLLNEQEVASALGERFTTAPATSNDLLEATQCIYTAPDIDPAGIVITSVGLGDGEEAFQRNRDRAANYYAGPVQPLEVDGAQDAYVVIERDLAAPVIGMLAGGVPVELQVGLSGVSVEQAQELAELIAARLR